MINSLVQAINFAVDDRCRSWHGRHAPEEERNVDLITDRLANSTEWRQVAESEIALRRKLKAPGGKMYDITYLPLASFALRYWVVMQLSAPINSLWTARIGAERLFSRGRRSLFLGRTNANARVYHSWMNAQNARYLLKVDVRSFYDSISHEPLCRVITTLTGNELGADQRAALELLPLLLRYRYQEEGHNEVWVCERGLPIGNTTERFFSNAYLASIDDFLLSQPNLHSCRKLDDIRVYGDDKEQLRDLRKEIQTRLLALGLSMNEDKTRIIKRSNG